MALSKRKLKYIRRFAGKKAPADIARDLGISASLVVKALASPSDSISEKTARRNTADVSPGARKTSDIWPYLIGAVILISPFLLFGKIHNASLLPKYAFIQTAALGLVAIWFFGRFREGQLSINRRALYPPLLLFIGWSLLSLVWASSRYIGFNVWTQWFACTLIFFLVVQTVRSEQDVRILFTAITWAGTGTALIGIAQYLGEYDGIYQAAGPAATFMNKNMAAQFVVLAIPGAVSLLAMARQRSTLWLSTISLSILTAFLFYTFTRAAWLAFAGQLAVLGATLFIIQLRKVKLIADQIPPRPLLSRAERSLAAATGLLATFVLINTTPEGLKWRIDDAFYYLSGIKTATSFFRTIERETAHPQIQKAKEAPTTEESPASEMGSRQTRTRGSDTVGLRLTWWWNTFEMIKGKPLLGTGLNNFQVFYPLTQLKGKRDRQLELFLLLESPHSDLLQLTAELGIIFIICLVWFACNVVQAIHRILSNPVSQDQRWVGIVSAAAIVGLGVNMGFSFPLYRSLPPLLLAVYSAVLFRLVPTQSAAKGDGQRRISRKDRHKISHRLGVSRGKSVALVCWLTFSIATLTWAVLQYRWLRADYLFTHQRRALVREDPRENIHWGNQVLQLNPFRLDAQDYMGRAFIDIGKLDLALEHLRSYHEANPNATFNLYNLARCLERKKDYEAAFELVQHALAILPEEGRLHDSRGRLLRAMGRANEAWKAFRTAARLSRRDHEIRHNLGTHAHSMGLFDEAAEAFEKALALDETYAPSQKWLGLTYVFKLDRPKEGVRHLKRALELDPDIVNAEQMRRVIAEYKGKY